MAICPGAICPGTICPGAICPKALCPGAICHGSICAGAICPGDICPRAYCPGAICLGDICPGAYCPGAIYPGAICPLGVSLGPARRIHLAYGAKSVFCMDQSMLQDIIIVPLIIVMWIENLAFLDNGKKFPRHCSWWIYTALNTKADWLRASI